MTTIALSGLSMSCKFPFPADVKGDAGSTVTDAAIDARSFPAFDLAYPAEWKFSVAGPTSGFLLVVNTGPSPLNLASFQLRSISDDHSTAEARVTTQGGFNVILQPEQAGGQLSQQSESVLVQSLLVPESRIATDADLMTLELRNAPSGTYDVAATVTLSLDGIEASLPMTIHVVPGPEIFLDPLVGRRDSVFR